MSPQNKWSRKNYSGINGPVLEKRVHPSVICLVSTYYHSFLKYVFVVTCDRPSRSYLRRMKRIDGQEDVGCVIGDAIATMKKDVQKQDETERGRVRRNSTSSTSTPGLF